MPLARFVARLTIICVLSCLLLITASTQFGKTQRGYEIAYLSFESYFASGGSQSSQIRLLDVDKRLDVLLGASASPPIWSPNGEQLLFTAYSEDTASSEIFILDLHSNDIRRLTQNSDTEGITLWIPNSNQILITAFERAPDGVFTYLLDTTTGAVTPFEFQSPLATILSWSPDGRFVIYTAPVLGAGYELVIWDTTLEQVNTTLAIPQFDIDALAWSPDGQHFVGTKMDDVTRTFQIYVSPIDHFVPRQISSGGILNSNPAWSPDGRFIVYTQSINGCCEDGDLMLIDLETGEQSRLVHHDAASIGAMWRP